MEDRFKKYIASKGLIIKGSLELPNLRDLTVISINYTEKEMVKAITCRLFDPTITFVVTDLREIFTGKRGDSRSSLPYETLRDGLDLLVYKGNAHQGYKGFSKDDLNYPDLFLRARRRATQYNISLEELAENVSGDLAEDIKKIASRMKEFIRRYESQKKE